MTLSQDLARRLVVDVPEVEPLMQTHLADQEGELLPYLFLADVARWAHATYASDPTTVGRVVDWLEQEFVSAEADEKDLIGLGFVEALPFPPEGAPILLRLGPELTRVAQEIGLLS